MFTAILFLKIKFARFPLRFPLTLHNNFIKFQSVHSMNARTYYDNST